MKHRINILYVSTLCSPRISEFLFKTSNNKPAQSAQKFHRLLTEGLIMHDECVLETLSLIPVIASSHKKRFWKIKSEKSGRIDYHYVPFINVPILKEIITFIFTFTRIVFWSLTKLYKSRVIVCDIQGLSISFGALIACKFTKTKIIAILTDLPGLNISVKDHINLKTKLYIEFSNKIITKYSGYILLTEQMNEIVNYKKRPYIIMEGLVDIKMSSIENLLSQKSTERILIYAGGILERYGIKNLIEAFMKMEYSDLRLDIYGSGDMEKYMPHFMDKDNRIRYKGVVLNNEVINCQREATLLLNPRPTKEAFTKFSFPSKNMEYMVSGTPIVTTQLPGMPKEYYQFVYIFDDESIDGMYRTLKSLLLKPKDELHNFGILAKQFVLENKNNYRQAERIIEFIKNEFTYFANN